MLGEIQICPWPSRPLWLTLSEAARCAWCGRPATEVAIADVDTRKAVLICQECAVGGGHDC